jgi:uncharacterized membrane protein (DUF373 family)
LKRVERWVLCALMAMMGLVVVLATVELGWIIVKDVLTPPVILLEIEELLEIFGFFLLVLIGIELLETLRAYVVEQVIHAEIVLVVAMIAIGRKVVTLDVKLLEPLMLVGIAAVMLSLAGAYYIVRTHTAPREPQVAHRGDAEGGD